MVEIEPSKNAKAIVKGLWVVILVFLIYYFLDTRTAIESMAQDYPSSGLTLISKWAPMFFPVPCACYLLHERFPKLRKPMMYGWAAIILFVVIAVVEISLTTEINWVMSKDVLIKYFFFIFIGSILAFDFIRLWFEKSIDRLIGWD